jgi:voltage-gated potassium channel Kch
MTEDSKSTLFSKPVVALVFVLMLISLVGGGLFYYYAEGLTPVDAFYFAAMTMTTVGYGDFVPKTDLGKIFTAFYAFVGIGLFFGLGAMLFQTALGRMNKIHEHYKETHKDS